MSADSALQEMGRTTAGVVDHRFPIMSEIDQYPAGLSITLTENELEKLGLGDDPDIGDLLHICALAKVVSVHKDSQGIHEVGKDSVRISLQITHMAVEDEDEENDESDEAEEGEDK